MGDHWTQWPNQRLPYKLVDFLNYHLISHLQDIVKYVYFYLFQTLRVPSLLQQPGLGDISWHEEANQVWCIQVPLSRVGQRLKVWLLTKFDTDCFL